MGKQRGSNKQRESRERGATGKNKVNKKGGIMNFFEPHKYNSKEKTIILKCVVVLYC